MHDHNIVSISYVVSDAERVFCILVEFMEVDINEELGSEVAKWESVFKTANDRFNMLIDVFVFNMFFKKLFKARTISTSKTLFDIKLEYVTWFRVVSAHLICKRAKSFTRTMRTLTCPATIRVMDETLIKIRVERIVHKSMHDTITH